MKFSLLISLVMLAFTFGCGAKEDTLSTILTDHANTSPIKVHVSKSFGSERVVLVSSDLGAANADFCAVRDDQCVQVFNMKPVGKKAGRTIFGLGGFPDSMKGDYRIVVDGIRRDISFADSVPVTVPNGSGAGSWKSVFMAGDYSDNGQAVVAWDNARRDLAKLFVDRGFQADQVKHLSRDPAIHKQDASIGESSLSGLEKAFTDHNLNNADSCFLFMTSHGSRSGFYIEGGRSITPNDFSALLDKHCGTKPTVAIVSACYSGIMLNSNTQKDNRIIFTASSKDKTSNGCAPGVVYTFFDECIVESLNKNTIDTFDDLATDVKSCINAKENASNASFPQFFIGSKMKDLKIGGSAVAAPPAAVGNGNLVPPVGNASATNNIAGAKNLALVGTSGDTDLRKIAGSAKFLLIDFSSPSCGYCLQFAALLERNAQILGDSCKAVTLVNPGQLAGWNDRLDARGTASAKDHSFSLKTLRHGAALSALEGGSGSGGSVPTPTILLFDVEKNEVINKSVGALTESGLGGFLGSKCGG